MDLIETERTMADEECINGSESGNEDLFDKKEKKSRKVGIAVISVLSVFLVFFLLIFYFFSTPIWIQGDSMEPFLSESTNDRVVLLKKGYELDYGDIVVFERESEGRLKQVIKRVVGLEGDIIQIKAGILYRNGEKIEEDYVSDKNIDFFKFTQEYTVGEGEIYVLGDNRVVSLDSSAYGAVRLSALVGKAVYLIGDGKSMFIG